VGHDYSHPEFPLASFPRMVAQALNVRCSTVNLDARPAGFGRLRRFRASR